MALFGLCKKNKVKPADIFAELMTAVISDPIEYTHTLFQEKLVMAHSFQENGNEEMALEYFSAIKSAAIQLITISKAKENKGGIATDEELFETLNCATESIIFINEIYIARKDYAHVISNSNTDLSIMSDFLPLCGERFIMLLRVLQFYSQLLHAYLLEGHDSREVIQKINELTTVICSFVEFVDTESQRALLNYLCDFVDRVQSLRTCHAAGHISITLYRGMNWSELSSSNYCETGILLGRLANIYLAYPAGETEMAEKICNDEIKLLELAIESEDTLRNRYNLAVAISHLATVAINNNDRKGFIELHLRKISALGGLILENPDKDIDEMITRKVLSDSICISIRNIIHELEEITSDYSTRILEELTYYLLNLHFEYRDNIQTIEAANQIAQVLTTIYIGQNNAENVAKFSQIKFNNLFTLLMEYGAEPEIVKDIRSIYSLVHPFVEEHKDDFSDTYLELYNLASQL